MRIGKEAEQRAFARLNERVSEGPEAVNTVLAEEAAKNPGLAEIVRVTTETQKMYEMLFGPVPEMMWKMSLLHYHFAVQAQEELDRMDQPKEEVAA